MKLQSVNGNNETGFTWSRIGDRRGWWGVCLKVVVEKNENGLLAVVVLVATSESHVDALLKERIARDEKTLVGAPAFHPV